MTIQELKVRARELRDKAATLKTKKARSKLYDSARELETQALIKLCDERDKYGTFSFKAVVYSFTPGSEHYLAKTPYGLMWLSPCGDILSKSWYPGTCCIEYTKGQTILVGAKVDIDWDKLCLNIVPIKITGGRVNETQYSELCQKDNLAFFKYPAGMSGLFATKKRS